MAIKKKNMVFLDDGSTALTGINIGKYPKHHFTFNRGFLNQPGWPLKVISVGDDEWVKGCFRRRENSLLFALEFVQSGSFRFVQENRKYDVGPGEVFLVQFDKTSEMSVNKVPYAFKKTMIISGEILRAMLISTGLDSVDVVKVSQPDKLAELFDNCKALCADGKPGFMDEASCILYRILMILGQDTGSRELPEELKTALNFFEENLGRQLTIKELSRQCGISPATLHRLFSRYCDVSPIEFFIRRKMEVARELLEISQYSIKEIALQLGYSNQLYFSSEFKKRCKVSPRAYRLTPRQESS